MTTKDKKFRYIFGPVTSRRLGISLGIDLIPLKTCSLDCIYCECGGTTNLTNEIKEYIPFDDLKDELETYLSGSVKLDAVTFAGSGEPTLYSRIDEVIDFLKKDPKLQVVLLTNSTLFSDESVRKRVLKADSIIASFDAASEKAFRKINRPHKEITVKRIQEGLLKLKDEFKNKLIIEIFIVPGINDDIDELTKIRDFVKKLDPFDIQINALDRPGTCDWVDTLSDSRRDEIESFFGVKKKMDKNLKTTEVVNSGDIEELILQTIKRRPCTFSDLKKMTGKDSEVDMAVKKLIDLKRIEIKKMPRGDFFYLKKEE